MLKFITITAAVIAVAMTALVAYASTRPENFRVTRSLIIKAPPEKLFGMINDLRQFNEWNPFERKEPGTGRYQGPANGVGASYAWEGRKVGTGSMTISEIVPNERITMDLAFLKPFKADNIADFTFVPKADGTEVTWAMRGPAPLLSKIMDVVIGMDRMVGQDFEQGLANLRTIAET